MKKNNVIQLDRHTGEIRHDYDKTVRQKYKSESILFTPAVSYTIALLCCLIDAYVFYSTFSLISYDSAFTRLIQVIGFVIAADITPVFLANEFSRMRAGLSSKKIVIVLGIIVLILVFTMNTAIVLTTIDLRMPSSFSDTEERVDPAAIANTIFAIFIPMVTSSVSFLVGYMSADPIEKISKKLEMLIVDKKEDIRRVEAFISEYELDKTNADFLEAEDNEQFEAMVKVYQAMTLEYCTYVRQRLKEHLATPSAVDAITATKMNSIIGRLNEIEGEVRKPLDCITSPLTISETVNDVA